MRKQILTDNETKTFLMKTFGCSRQAVWQALEPFVIPYDATARPPYILGGNSQPNIKTFIFVPPPINYT